MDILNSCAMLIANWICAICLSGNCELSPRVEVQKASVSALRAYTIVVSIDQPVTIPEESLTVELVGVEDNRCAVEVKCVWAGEARVTLRLSKPGAASASVVIGALKPASNNTSASTYGIYRLTLVSLEPGNSIAAPVAQTQYRATVSVSSLITPPPASESRSSAPENK